MGRGGFKVLAKLSFFLCLLPCSKSLAREWTILVYAAGDEEATRSGILHALRDIEGVRGLSSNEVAVVAQLDDYREIDGKQVGDPNFRYLLKPGGPEAEGVRTPPIPEEAVRATAARFHDFTYGERDSGDPATLFQFLDWAVTAYPAKHYALVLMGHSWGIAGVMQDFFVNGQVLEEATIMPNYLVAEVLREIYRRNSSLIPEKRFDAIIVDACIAGTLDVALEYQDVTPYFVASSLETPYHSIPYGEILESFVAKVRSRTYSMEQDLLRPLVDGFARSHAPGGSLVALEAQMDPVEMHAVKTSQLPAVETALGELVKSLPADWAEHTKALLDPKVDGDGNIDLLEFSKAIHATYPDNAPARKLGALLASSEADVTTQGTELSHPRATGAWVYVDTDSAVESFDLVTCLTLKSLLQSNLRTGLTLLLVKDEDGKAIDLKNEFCDELGEEAKSHPVESGLHEMGTFFGHTVEWPSGVPAYLWEKKEKRHRRRLALWVDKLGISPILRLPGTERIRVDYFTLKDGDRPKDFLLKPSPLETRIYRVPAFQSMPESDLYVAESHTNGTPFKQGLSIVLAPPQSVIKKYYDGWRPLKEALVTPSPLSIVDYLESLKLVKDPSEHRLTGKQYYRAHRIARTGWDQMLRW